MAETNPSGTPPPPESHLGELHHLNLSDFLSPLARQERRLYLGVSTLGVLVAQTGLVPSKISALGIEFEKADQRTLLLVLVLTLVYFTVAFALCAVADFLAWRTSYDASLLNHLREEHGFYLPQASPKDGPAIKRQKEIMRRQWWWGTLSRKTATIRALWEFAFPFVLGVYSIGALLLARHRL